MPLIISFNSFLSGFVFFLLLQKMCFIVRSNLVTENGPYDDITIFFYIWSFMGNFYVVYSKIKYNDFNSPCLQEFLSFVVIGGKIFWFAESVINVNVYGKKDVLRRFSFIYTLRKG